MLSKLFGYKFAFSIPCYQQRKLNLKYRQLIQRTFLTSRQFELTEVSTISSFNVCLLHMATVYHSGNYSVY